MHVISVRNVNQALPEALRYLEYQGVWTKTRNGRAIRAPEPVCIHYRNPTERVLFEPKRDANPFFHLLEAMWMLAGRNDVAYVEFLVPRMADYSDDAKTFNAAYGHRWRKHFGRDQLTTLIKLLKAHPNTRRAVLQIWDQAKDLHDSEAATKDAACNTQVYFKLNNEGKLDMTVTNRSNDLIWGACGANVVHFSVLQEYMAAKIGVEVGGYWQVSNDLHAYEELYERLKGLSDNVADGMHSTKGKCAYIFGDVKPFPMVSDPERWDSCHTNCMLNADDLSLGEPFFKEIVVPYKQMVSAYKNKRDPARYDKALGIAESMVDCDWKKAAKMWLTRRKHELEKKNASS